MAFNYSKMQQTANKLIEGFGSDSLLRKVTNSGTNYAPTLVEVDYNIKAVVTEFQNSVIDGTDILRNDKLILISVNDLTVAPEINDKIVIDSKEYKVINIREIKPASVTVYWEVQGRNG